MSCEAPLERGFYQEKGKFEMDDHQLRTIMPPRPSNGAYVMAPYKIVDNVVQDTGFRRPTRRYLPAHYPDLPQILARLQDEDDLLEFANQFGLLGYDQLVQNPEQRLNGDPIPWIRSHVETISLCLELSALIEAVDVIGIERRLVVEDGIMAGISYAVLDQVTAGMQFVPVGADILSLARQVRREIINANMRRMYRVLHPIGEKDAIAFGFNALIETIYEHLANDISKGLRIRSCEACGKYLVERRRGQRYCPPPIGWKDSKCAVRARARGRRAKSKQKQP